MNCSTAAMRHITSSLADPFTAVAGAAGALFGPLHGGANEVRTYLFYTSIPLFFFFFALYRLAHIRWHLLLPLPRKAVLRMLESIGAKENVSKFLEEVLSSTHNARCECTGFDVSLPSFLRHKRSRAARRS
jgi:hypothetical protein